MLRRKFIKTDPGASGRCLRTRQFVPDGMPSPCNSHCDKLLQLTQSFNSAIGDSHPFSPFSLIVWQALWGYWLWVVFMGVACRWASCSTASSTAMAVYGPYVGFPMMLVMAISLIWPAI